MTKHRPKPLSRAALAKLRGVSRQAVSTACRPGGSLAPAVSGKYVDAAHPSALAWLAKRPKPPEPPAEPEGAPADIGELLTWPLGKIVDTYGSIEQCERAVSLRKNVVSAQRIELENRKTAGEVISRELVKSCVFGALERLNRHLLKPVPDTVVARAIEMREAGRSLEEIRKVAREIMSSELKATWSSVSAALRAKP